MISRTFRRFAASRRSAVAVIMAISLVPLMLLVGIAVDFTFLYQSRTQTAFASQAASTQALRIAAATYALEVANGSTSTVAAQHAIAAGNTLGNLWFDANLGSLTRATLASRSTNTTYDGNTTGVANPNLPPNFTAVVTDTASYPPIFNPLFGSTRNWSYSSNATGTSSYAYAQILLMLDTSGSMLIGANQPDILTMERGSVCPIYTAFQPSDYQPKSAVFYNSPAGYYTTALNSLSSGYYTDAIKEGQANSDGDELDFTTIPNYSDPTKTSPNTDNTGHCASGHGAGSAYLYYSGQNATAPAIDCALACHSSQNTFTANGTTYPADLYGLARSENVTLRIDVMFSATEQVIKDMQSSEAVANQLSVGIYQFNADVLPIATGSSGAASTAGGSGDALPEATTDLAGALSAVQAVDYKVTPSETKIPLLQYENTAYSKANLAANPEVTKEGGVTNFKLSMADLISGTFPTTTQGKLVNAGAGATAATPLKFMFIVTDGMDDSDAGNGGGESGVRVIGDMTSISGENAGTGNCSAIKKLGYTVYVLYVTYYPLADTSYYRYSMNANAATLADFSAKFPSAGSATAQTLSEVPSVTSLPQRYTQSPEAQALQACASNAADFYQASSASDIQTALNQMLKSALASTIRLTN
jgi:hypothetical protein